MSVTTTKRLLPQQGHGALGTAIEKQDSVAHPPISNSMIDRLDN